MGVELTHNAIKDLLSGVELQNPVVQITALKALNGPSERFRCFISDGVHSTGSAMFGSQLNEKVKSKEIDTFTVIQITHYVLNAISTPNPLKKVFIILGCTVVEKGNHINKAIGNPVPYDPKSAPQTNVAQPRAPLQSRNGNPPPSPATKPVGVHSIESLTPYQNKWTIRARVTSKSDLRTYSNSRGEGRLFSMDLLDESGEIKATAFNEQCDKYFNMIEVDKVYYITQATLKTARKEFSSLKNDYEMTFNSGTQVTLCTDSTDIPAMQFEFVSIELIEQLQKDSIVDVIGICKVSEDLTTLTQKSTGKELKKRDLQLVDDSGKEIRLTLWGQQAENFDGSAVPVIAVKGVKVSDFNGKSLSVLSNSNIQINPDLREAHKLRFWYDTKGSKIDTVNLSNQRTGASGLGGNFKCLGQAAAEGLGSNNTADYYSCKATTTLVKHENCLYPSCPSDNCNKKVVDMNNGVYRCEKCNKEYETFDWRLMVSANVSDGTDNVWITMFQDQAETLLGCSAKELASKKESDSTDFQDVFQAATFKELSLKLRVKMETYNEETRLKTTAVTVAPVDYVDYNRKLVEEIKKLANN